MEQEVQTTGEIITRKQAAEILNVSRDHVYLLGRCGKIKYIGENKFLLSSVIEYRDRKTMIHPEYYTYKQVKEITKLPTNGVFKKVSKGIFTKNEKDQYHKKPVDDYIADKLERLALRERR